MWVASDISAGMLEHVRQNAARAGLQPGSIILSVDGKPVMHPDALKSALSGTAGPVRLTVADPQSNRESEIEIER